MAVMYASNQTTKRIRVVSIHQLEKITEGVRQHPAVFALDLETTGLNARKHKIATMQFGTLKYKYVLDLRRYYDLSSEEQDEWKRVIANFIDAVPTIVGHNLAFDWQFLYVHFGVRMNRVVDTMLQEQIIHSVGLGGSEGAGTPVNMQDTGTRYGLRVSKDAQVWFVGLDQPRKFYAGGQYYADVSKKGVVIRHWFNADGTACSKDQEPKKGEQPVRESDEQWYADYPDHQLDYMEQDVIIPLQLQAVQTEKLKKLDMVKVAALENAALPAFAWLCACGCHVDTERWQRILKMKRARHSELEVELSSVLGQYMKDIRQAQYNEKLAEYNAWNEKKSAATNELTKEYSKLFVAGETGGLTVAQYVKQYLPEMIGDQVKKPTPKDQREIAAPINLGSHVQLKAALSRIGIYVTKTDKKALGAYKKNNVVAMLLEWKALDKFISAFGDNILALVDVDGRIHPTYAQIGARTGRTSCAQPNWQQLPSHEPDETSVRKCVIAEPGNVLLTCDLPNIELRILAELSGDKKMLSIFAAGGDVHSLTAIMMFGLPENTNPKETYLRPGLNHRSVAKTINFGLAYGMGAGGLAESLGIEREEAVGLLETYKATYRTAMTWLDNAAKIGLEKGHSATILGRKRFYRKPLKPFFDRDLYGSWDEFRETDEWKNYSEARGYIERESKNSPIQGTNADITKAAMLLLYYSLPKGCSMVASVHDEVVIECSASIADEVKLIVQDCMYKACRQFLKVVAINKEKELDVVVAPYWKKE